jgi:O-antigen ligase
MVRSVLGVVVGVVLWAVGFYVLALLLAQLWPDYAIHGREWTRQGVYTFTPAMACCNLVFWVLAEILAGWVAGKIAKRRASVWVLAGLLGIYFAVLHFVILWTRFPWWYNLGVVIPAVPAVLLGGTLANALRAQGRASSP